MARQSEDSVSSRQFYVPGSLNMNDASQLRLRDYAAKARAGRHDLWPKFQLWALLACSSVHLRFRIAPASAFEPTERNFKIPVNVLAPAVLCHSFGHRREHTLQ